MVFLLCLTLALALARLGSAGPVGPRATSSLTDTALGCYTDASNRTLDGVLWSDNSLTIPLCLSYCSEKAYSYAGVEDGDQCFCGHTLDASRKTIESKCTMACDGDDTTICGGPYLINVYALASTTSSTSVLGTSTPIATSTKAATKVVASTTKVTATTSAVATVKTNTSTSAVSTKSVTTNSTSPKATTSSMITTPIATTTKSMTTAVGTGTIKATSTTLAVTNTKTTTATSTVSTRSGTAISASRTVTTSSTTTNPVVTSMKPTTSTVPYVEASSSVIGLAAPPSATGSKYLYAHLIVGNTASYTQATWTDDIDQAASAGIDGFALNLGSDSWEADHVSEAYAAAQDHGSFQLFLSLDFTSLTCASTSDGINVAALIAANATSPIQATHSGKTLVGTFFGDSCTFGQSNATSGWAYVRSLLFANKVEIYLVPAIFVDPSTFSSLTWMDGELNWNSGWPSAGSNLDGSTDIEYMNALGNKSYMPAISPCFFTYYGPDSWNKDWIYRSDDWLLATRMEMIVAMRNKVDFAEIISWNDYGESHYIGPIRADQPNSQGWTNGMPHTAWLSMIAYYAPAFKTGTYPSPSDNLWLWSRPHPKAANATAPSNPKPTGWDYTDDNVYALVTLSSPADVTITSGTNTGTWALPAGLSKLSLTSLPGSIGGTVVRGSSTVKSYDSTGTFTYVATPTDYNFNYFVAQA